MRIGILRESGHEHFAGSLVIPVIDDAGGVHEIYGRKVRDDLRSGTAKHLFLDGGKRVCPTRGVWNEPGIQGQDEVILCEALIDALTFWCAGFRNVTATYGADVFGDEHVACFTRLGVKRVLIAFDRDDAGDRGAAAVRAKLAPLGIGCFRVQFPHRMDANEYAMKTKPARMALGLLLQSAIWMGQGPPPPRTMSLLSVAPAPAQERAAEEEGAVAASFIEDAGVEHDELEELDALEEPTPVEPAPPSAASVTVPATLVAAPAVQDVNVRLEGDDVHVDLGARRYRVRGLGKNTSHDQLRVNVLVCRDTAFHVDTLDLYSSRQRQAFTRQASLELAVNEEILRKDLGKVFRKIEELRDARIKKALEPKNQVVAIPDDRRAAALRRLEAPGLIDWIVESLDACGMVGERTNKLVAYLAAVSRLLTWPLAILVQSTSAAGKTALMEKVLALMPEEDRVKYSAMTGQSLFYMGDKSLSHKILAIAEEEGASRASYALKLLQSEGELSIASTGKDPSTGKLVTHDYTVKGPVMLFLTTTAIELDEELENRCVKLSVDEGREQTRRIHELQRQMMTLEGIIARKKQVKLVELHQDVQRMLRPLAVRIPCAMRLTFPDYATRTRRDHMKYLTLIQSIALLHQHQRAVKKLEVDGEVQEFVDATVEDIRIANELANEALGRSLAEVPPQTQVFLERLELMVGSGGGEARSDCRVARREIREALRMSDKQVRVHLGRLVELEYVLVHRGPGQSLVYELLYNGEARLRERFMLGLADVEALRKPGTTTGVVDSGGEVVGFEGRVVGGSWPGSGGSVVGEWGGSKGVDARQDVASSGSGARTAENAYRVPKNGDGRSRSPLPPA